MNEDVTQRFEVRLYISAHGAHDVQKVLDTVRSQLNLLPLNMHLEDASECMQVSERNTHGDFICYDIVREYGPESERYNGVALDTPWTGHEDHSREEHLPS